jgi:hypothetical protein
MRLRDLFVMRAHFGWVHVIVSRIAQRVERVAAPLARPLNKLLDAMERRTHRRTAQFDAQHGTRTFARLDVKVSDDPDDGLVWGYAAINRDFFREILQSIDEPLADYHFVDIGAGMGAAVLFASEFDFRGVGGIELDRELLAIAHTNTEAYNRSTGRRIAPTWIGGDFFKWKIPPEPQLFFMNNPFPEALTLEAIKALEQSLRESPRRALLVFRKAPMLAGNYLHRSAAWKPLRLAPYWRVYSAVTPADAAARA